MIILEGIALYIFLTLLVLTFLILLITLTVAIIMAKRKLYFENLTLIERKKVLNLKKENFILKIKCGEFDFNDE